MQIKVFTVGKRMPDWIEMGTTEYSKRFPPELAINIQEITPGKRHKGASKEKVMREEAERILERLPKNHTVIALDEHGKQHDTLSLSKQLQTWMQEGQNISFVLGGADGLDQSVLDKADGSWSLSSFTLPHGLARVVLVEQLYRAWSLLKNHPYHRE